MQLQRMYQAMKEADQDYDGTLHSRSGLVGTDGGKLEHYVEQEEPICGDFLGRVMEKAVKMGAVSYTHLTGRRFAAAVQRAFSGKRLLPMC